MKKILIVFGTRPEAIKMAPVVKKFQADKVHFDTKVCVTGQHREMLDQVLDIFQIKPEYDLNIMKAGQDLYDVTAKVVVGMRDVLRGFKPDYVFVHGDTTTSSMAALASFYEQIPVAHVEAGLRTNNKYSPWPEEVNRQLTGRISTLHFAPTETAKQNLLKENIDPTSVFVTGNTVIDALFMVLEKIRTDKSLQSEIENRLAEELSAEILTGRYILVTGHRRENFGEGFLNICDALLEIAQKHTDVNIIYPVHLNPNVRKPVFERLGDQSNIHLIEPLEYLPFVYLMSKSYLLLTDSGGIQEEAPALGKPVLVMRDTTERPEAVEAGTVKLVGTVRTQIVQEVEILLDDKEVYTQMANAKNPYGTGDAKSEIRKILIGL